MGVFYVAYPQRGIVHPRPGTLRYTGYSLLGLTLQSAQALQCIGYEGALLVHCGLYHPRRCHVSIRRRLWPSPWPIAGDENLALFWYLLFCPSFRFSLFTLIRCYSVVNSFFSPLSLYARWPRLLACDLLSNP